MVFQSEREFENAVVSKLIEYGWEETVIYHPTEEQLIQNWADILFANNRQIDRLNESPLTSSEMEQILEQVISLKTPVKLNGFINGRSVSVKRDNPDDPAHLGKEVSLKIYDRNEIALGESRYQIAVQPQFSKKSELLNDRRGDIILLINGMPVIHIELKKSGIPVSQAYNQIRKYAHEGIFTGIYSLVQLFVAMEPEESVYFANPGENNFNTDYAFHWADFNNEPINEWSQVIAHLLNIPMAHQLIGFYTVPDTSDGVLKVLRSYQYYAANGISTKVSKKDWNDNDQLGGFVWHTTGSGKTMTSFKSAQLISSSRDADKVVFLVDRVELGTQSLKEYRSFTDELQSIQATEDTSELISKLKSDDPDNTLIVTSIQKLSNISEENILNTADIEAIQDKRLVIIIDECHRSTFGKMLAEIKKTFKTAYIFGFTGTPIQEVNMKKDSTTPTIFGDEIHRYTLSDGIRDKNVLGFDQYMGTIYPDSQVREQVALYRAKANTVAEVMEDEKKKEIYYQYLDSSQIKMAGYEENGKYVNGIEDYLPTEQYQTLEYQEAVVDSIKEKWLTYSRGNKFHAMFATSSIPEAVKYYQLFKERMPELKVTALFDPTIDNEGQKSLDKEDGVVDILRDYNNMFNQNYTIPTYSNFRKDVSQRLAHKSPYLNPKTDEQIDLLIVVNQMLTGFDSKWVNTLYIDKMLVYEHLIQAISRTNRIYNNVEKPFGIIKYFRRPHTMKRNIEEAVKTYSGDIPTGLFVDKLPKNLNEMNRLFEEMKELFSNEHIHNFETLPSSNAVKGKFAKFFKEFSNCLEAASIQGFNWDEKDYVDEENEEVITVVFEEGEYLTLLQRYKELSSGGGRRGAGDVPFDIDINIIEHNTGQIDTNYMNSRFEKYLKALEDDENSDYIQETLQELHRSFSMLPQQEQKYGQIFINDVRSGNAKLELDKTFREYIIDYQKQDEERKIKTISDQLGSNKELLRKLFERRVTEYSIDRHGDFSQLKSTVNKEKARRLFYIVLEDKYDDSRLSMYIDNYLRDFLLEDDDPYEVSNDLPYDDRAVEVVPIDVELKQEDLVGKRVINTISAKQLDSWYQESNAVRSLINSDQIAYVEDSLVVLNNKYIERNSDGTIRLTAYAKDHPEESFLQFIIDEDTGELHYVSLPESLASKTFNYYDEISEELLEHYGLVGQMSKEMLKAIEHLDFGEAFKKLMSKNICNYTTRLLQDTTGLDLRTISNLRKGENLTKVNVISACLGIHIPAKVSERMIVLADLNLDESIPGNTGFENMVYDQLLSTKWASDYSDIYDSLVKDRNQHLIKKPKI